MNFNTIINIFFGISVSVIMMSCSHKEKVLGLVGSYTQSRALNKEEFELFNDTYKGDEPLKPIKVSTQVVAGVNYRFECKSHSGKKVNVVIFKQLPCNGGESQVISIEK